MRIKELEDVLALVDAMPREEQLQCVRACVGYVEDWEARKAEPPMTDEEWIQLNRARFNKTMEVRKARLAEKVRQVEKELKKRGIRRRPPYK